MPSRERPDWSRRLPRPLTIPTVMTLATLADARTLIEKHLPKDAAGIRRGATLPSVLMLLSVAPIRATPRHSGIAITMDIYSHLTPNMQAEAAAKVDAALKAVDKNAS